MIRWYFLRFVLAAAFIMVATTPRAGERIALRVSPMIGFAPANLVVRTTIEADKDNRAMEVIADSENFYRSSEIQLDGEDAPRTIRLEFRNVPSGVYDVRAILKGSGGRQLASMDTHVEIVEAGR